MKIAERSDQDPHFLFWTALKVYKGESYVGLIFRELGRPMYVGEMSDEEINVVQQRMYPGDWSAANLKNPKLRLIELS